MSHHIVPALCLDLDGTVRKSKTGVFINGPKDIELLPGVEEKIWEYQKKGFYIVGITNQGGVAHGLKTTEQFCEERDATFDLFNQNPFDAVLVCFNDPKGKVAPYNIRSLSRKPDYGMLARAEVEAYLDGLCIYWDNSLFVGDRPEDEACAKAARVPFQWAWDFFGFEKPVERKG